MLKASAGGISFGMLIFLSSGIVASLLFGKQIEIIGANLIVNINQEYQIGLKKGENHWESFVLRGLFMIVMAC